MHELSLLEGVRDLIEDAARREKFGGVRTVWLEIGELSCVEPEALAFAFDEVMRDSVAAGARLEILRIRGRGWCAQCAAEVPLHELHAACPHCGGYGLQVRSGGEMRLKELEVRD